MADLFKDNLEQLNLSAVIEFLGINAPEEQRPPEGARLDFKQTLTQDLASDVAAFANTSGGLIFIGVSSSKTSTKQNVAMDAPGCPLGPDARARIANIISTTVNPLPNFEVQSFAVDAQGNSVAVLRVIEGNYPPYECQRSGDFKIPMRVLDTTRQASLREIEKLIEKRAAMGATASAAAHEHLRDVNLERMQDCHVAILVPLPSLNLQLDRQFEQIFTNRVREVFKRLGHFDEFRKGNFYKIDFEFGRTIGSWVDGGFLMAANLNRRGSPGEYVGDMLDDLYQSFRLAWAHFTALSHAGQCLVLHMMKINTLSQLLPLFEIAHGKYPVQGISLAQPRPNGRPAVTEFERLIGVRELEQPYRSVADIALQQLRESWGADVDLGKLTLEIRTRWA